MLLTLEILGPICLWNEEQFKHRGTKKVELIHMGFLAPQSAQNTLLSNRSAKVLESVKKGIIELLLSSKIRSSGRYDFANGSGL